MWRPFLADSGLPQEAKAVPRLPHRVICALVAALLREGLTSCIIWRPRALRAFGRSIVKTTMPAGRANRNTKTQSIPFWHGAAIQPGDPDAATCSPWSSPSRAVQRNSSPITCVDISRTPMADDRPRAREARAQASMAAAVQTRHPNRSGQLLANAG